MVFLHRAGLQVKPGKIVCIGRNYAKHAAELGNVVPSQPIVFLKPSTALVPSGGAVIIPPQTENVHHEVELVAIIGESAKNVDPETALSVVDGYAVGLDLTARDIQSAAKKKGHPWSIAKGFDTFAPLGDSVPAEQIADVQNLRIGLRVNGEMRQDGQTRDMIFSVAQLISYVSSVFTLEPGDLLYTGTPEGVGPIAQGDHLVATVDSMPSLEVTVA